MLSNSFPILINDSTATPVINGLIEKGCYRVISADHVEQSFLCYQDQSLTITLKNNETPLSLKLDFIAGKANHRRQYGGGKNQPLAKACGLDKHPSWRILDATAGLGRDAFVLASLGAHVTLCEQHPVIYGLLADAVYRAADCADTAEIVSRMTCLHKNTLDYLCYLGSPKHSLPEVIYLDPMYPERKKSAKIKKEMQILQLLAGHSDDEGKLLLAALKGATHRVVVKRPKSADYLNNELPSYAVKSLNTRYDVYVVS